MERYKIKNKSNQMVSNKRERGIEDVPLTSGKEQLKWWGPISDIYSCDRAAVCPEAWLQQISTKEEKNVYVCIFGY